MAKPKFTLTSEQAISREFLDCSRRTLQKLKKEGKLIEDIHYVKHYGKGHRFSRKALLKFRRDNERKSV
jgi:hypothetical protein